MSDPAQETLVEAAASAFRDRDPFGNIVASAAWRDLAPEDRVAAFELQLRSRALEQVLDPQHRSTTVRAVLARLRHTSNF